jgi:tetratricopeptide (TPR) repeat protein
MKPFLLLTLTSTFTLTALAQEPFMIKAAFVPKEPGGNNFVGAVVAANATQIEYRNPITSQSSTVSAIKDFEVIFFLEPAEYIAAMDLYESGKYEDAKAQFAKYKNQTKAVANLPGNYHVLAAFHELECLRKLGDLKGLAEALQGFSKQHLTREYQLRQLDLYVLWDAVKSESWDRVLSVATDREKEKMPDDQLVQVLYCKALALHKLNRLEEAMGIYNMVITADAASSEGLVSKAALSLLDIYFKDEAVKTAMTDWGTDLEKKGSAGYNKLLEAGALARLYKKYFNDIKEMPEEYKKLMDFKAKEEEEPISN